MNLERERDKTGTGVDRWDRKVSIMVEYNKEALLLTNSIFLTKPKLNKEDTKTVTTKTTPHALSTT